MDPKRGPLGSSEQEEHTMGLDNPLHIAFLLVVLLMVFGAKRLPEMGKSLGHGLRGFKDAVSPDATPVLASAPERPEALALTPEPVAVEQPAQERAAA
jgi:sec-independent protein translocase protein TatA